MRILFLHQNFPAQFKALAPALAAIPGNQVTALRLGNAQATPGVQVLNYQTARASTPGIHPWLVDMESHMIRGEAVMRAALAMKQQGYTPDVVIAHPGWGESLFIKDVWPTARLGIYSEFYYHAKGADVGFDPEFAEEDAVMESRMRIKNLSNRLHFDIADAGLSPTHWQASTFPEAFRPKITVVHDGIDTVRLAPNPAMRIAFNSGTSLTRSDEIITFVNRNLEPSRGYHRFMRALPEIMAARPRARVLIIGGSEVSYGAAAPAGQTWHQIFLDEVKEKIDPSRVHFMGRVSYQHYLAVMQLSTVHVYLTVPFVLGWSLLEAMSMGCAIVASDTAPLREAITHGVNGRLVDFFDTPALASNVIELLANREEGHRLGVNARAFACEHYDLRAVCLPRQLDWVCRLAG